MQAVAGAIRILKAGQPLGARALTSIESAALAEIYLAYRAFVVAVVRRVLRDDVEAEDVTHDVFCALPRKIGRYEDGHFGGWIAQVATRAALSKTRRSRWRRERVRANPELMYGSNDCVCVEPTVAIDAERVHGLVRNLPESLRQVTLLRFFSGLDHNEIGVALGITATASEVRLCRAIKRLRSAANAERDLAQTA